jgi:hypothetical protein
VTFIVGVAGALLMIGATGSASFMAFADQYDRYAGIEYADAARRWIAKLRSRVRLCFWGGLAMTIGAAISVAT